MLAAYFDIKPRVTEQPDTTGGGSTGSDGKKKKPLTQPLKQPHKPKPRAPAASPKGCKGAKKAGGAVVPYGVEPYDSCTVHARFSPTAGSAPGPPPQEHATDPGMDLCEDEAGDPCEYLWQEANATGGQYDDDDTDSCVTFDDNASDTAELYGSSPADTLFDAAVLLGRMLKSRASEVPVYSGPELWFEDDDFIE